MDNARYLETVCQQCGTRAAEIVCHLCKTPRPGFATEPVQPAPAEAVCFDIFEEIERATRIFYPPLQVSTENQVAGGKPTPAAEEAP